jgi:hypothetical protein
MKKSELKKILKPLIRECIREVILEEKGIISSIVSEVANGLSTAAPTAQIVSEEQNRQEEEERHQQALEESKRKRKALLDSIGSDAYGGVDIFEGTTPVPAESNGQSPLSGRNPRDAGVDISSFIGKSPAAWKQLAGTDKKGRQ